LHDKVKGVKKKRNQKKIGIKKNRNDDAGYGQTQGEIGRVWMEIKMKIRCGCG
jgi:hypothetical protein